MGLFSSRRKPKRLQPQLDNMYSFKDAQAKAAESGGMVCATLEADGRPLYFVMPNEAADVVVHDRAFLMRNKRAITSTEKTLMTLVAQKQKQ